MAMLRKAHAKTSNLKTSDVNPTSNHTSTFYKLDNVSTLTHLTASCALVSIYLHPVIKKRERDANIAMLCRARISYIYHRTKYDISLGFC